MLEITTISELLDFKWLIEGACPQTSFCERGGGGIAPFLDITLSAVAYE